MREYGMCLDGVRAKNSAFVISFCRVCVCADCEHLNSGNGKWGMWRPNARNMENKENNWNNFLERSFRSNFLFLFMPVVFKLSQVERVSERVRGIQ